MVPDMFPYLPRSNYSLPPEAPPAIPNGVCSAQFLDTMPTKARCFPMIDWAVLRDRRAENG